MKSLSFTYFFSIVCWRTSICLIIAKKAHCLRHNFSVSEKTLLGKWKDTFKLKERT